MTQVFFSKNSTDLQSEFIDRVGNTIRNHLISIKRHRSLDQNRNCFIDTKLSQNYQQNNFDQNSYASSKNKWRISRHNRLNLTNKASLTEQKKQILQRFKSALKSKLNRKKQLEQTQNFYAHQKVRQMKQVMQSNKQQKRSIYINRKKKEIQFMKSILQRSKGQMNMRKRQRQLELSFTKWERAEQKFQKLRTGKTQNS